MVTKDGTVHAKVAVQIVPQIPAQGRPHTPQKLFFFDSVIPPYQGNKVHF